MGGIPGCCSDMMYSASLFGQPTFSLGQSAEVQAMDGKWHPCTICRVRKEGYTCESLSLGITRDEEVCTRACHFRFATLRVHQPAEIQDDDDGLWYPCEIVSVELDGYLCASRANPRIDQGSVYPASKFRFCTFGVGQLADIQDTGGLWYPCEIFSVERDGIKIQWP